MMGIAACTLLLASCSENDISGSAESKAIGFRNLNDRLTKAANDSSANYAVFAVRSDAQNVWFMDNVEVDGEDNTYDPVRYWPTGGATVNFYAFAPYSNNVAVTKTSNPNDKLPFVYTVPANGNQDFTIAKPITNATYSESNPTVALEFSHMLSKITMDVQLDPDLVRAGYSVSFESATLSVASSQGASDLTTQAALVAQGSSATYQQRKSYMFIPQVATGSSIQLQNVTIKHNNVDYWTGNMDIYTLSEGDIANNQFTANTHYKVMFTIGSDSQNEDGNPVFGKAIQFSSSIAANWNDSPVSFDQP